LEVYHRDNAQLNIFNHNKDMSSPVLIAFMNLTHPYSQTRQPLQGGGVMVAHNR
jgi:hypothetical protein